MKNKYQEAFEHIKRVVVFNKNYRDYENDLKVIKELVDKETPMKPKEEFDYDNGDLTYCSKCDEDISFGWSFCPDCGQRIDWSDE